MSQTLELKGQFTLKQYILFKNNAGFSPNQSTYCIEEFNCAVEGLHFTLPLLGSHQ